MMKQNEDLFCVYQKVGNEIIVYGIGHSDEEASRDALNYVDDVYDLCMTECSKEAFEYIQKHGGRCNSGVKFELDGCHILVLAKED